MDGFVKTQVGLIKEADGGALFVDELGQLPPCVQKRFPRALQERRMRPFCGDERKG
ncbi:MAG: sigma 54-interacting transcriptional regulator [Desulfobacterales bacterium]|nr:MAG: sigma 54-interacting transcriptional regulator [Desulfobacterales bacterium]